LFNDTEHHSLVFIGVNELITCVKNGEIADKLYVALLEIQIDVESFSCKMAGIKGFGLSLDNGWQRCRSW
jgi:hypothetical protein